MTYTATVICLYSQRSAYLRTDILYKLASLLRGVCATSYSHAARACQELRRPGTSDKAVTVGAGDAYDFARASFARTSSVHETAGSVWAGGMDGTVRRQTPRQQGPITRHPRSRRNHYGQLLKDTCIPKGLQNHDGVTLQGLHLVFKATTHGTRLTGE